MVLNHRRIQTARSTCSLGVGLAFAAWITLSIGVPGAGQSQPAGDSTYAARILARRQARDEEFRSRRWSPLAVIAIARLDKPRTTIGSAPEADLRLPAEGVAEMHAEILRQSDAGKPAAWRLRSVQGKISTEAETSRLVDELPLQAGSRVSVFPRTGFPRPNISTSGMAAAGLRSSRLPSAAT